MTDVRPTRLAARAQALYHIASAVASSLDVGEIGARAARAILDATGLRAGLVYVADHPARVARCIAAMGVPPDVLDRVRVTPLDGSTFTGRTLLTGVAQITRRANLSGVAGTALDFLDTSQFTIMPAHGGGAIVGTLNAVGPLDRLLDDDELAFLQAAADLLGLALHNAQLHEEAERERGRSRFLADVGHSFARVLDPDEVLADIVARATGVLSDWCVLYLLDAGRQVLELRAVHHADPRRADIVRRVFASRPLRVGEGVAGNVVLDHRPRVFARFDEAAIAELAPRDDVAYQAELRMVRSWACVPLIARDQAIGALIIATTGNRALTDDDLDLARAFAERAALGVDNALLYADASRRARESDFLAETTGLLTAATEPRILLARLARQATKLLGDGCGIFMVGRGHRWLPAAAVEHRDPAIAERIRLALRPTGTGRNSGPLGRELLNGGVVIANGPEALRKYTGTEPGWSFVESLGVQAMLATGIRSGSDLLGAMICIRHGPPPYTDDDARLIRLVADHTGSVLGNALLHARIAAERARLAAVIEQLPEGVMIVGGSQGQIVLHNRAAERLLGRSVGHEAVAEHPIVFHLTTADGTPYPEAGLPLRRALEGDVVHGAEVWVDHPDGTRLPLLVSAAPLDPDAGRVHEAVAVFQDISAIKEVERRKDEWLSIASHELRTPITSLKGFAQFLERRAQRGTDGELDPATLTSALATIVRQANRLAMLVNDLLDVSRIQRGRVELRLRPVDLRDVVRAAADSLGGLDATVGDRLALDLPDVPVAGEWDPDRLEQVVTNLVGNAVKYDPSGARVIVQVRQAPGMVVVEVQDQGIGVPAADLGTLFQPFHRAGNVTRGAFGGIGLGLYIARDIVERHGGRIWVASAEGHGTTVSFSLPLPEASTGPSTG